MKFAVVQNDIVQNVIVANEGQQAELSAALSAELVDATPLGLSPGDLRVNGQWTRNVDGEQTVLTERPTYDELVAALAELEAAAAGEETV